MIKNASFTIMLDIFLAILKQTSAVMYLQTFTVNSALIISARMLTSRSFKVILAKCRTTSSGKFMNTLSVFVLLAAVKVRSVRSLFRSFVSHTFKL